MAALTGRADGVVPIWPSGYPWQRPCSSLSIGSVQNAGQVKAGVSVGCTQIHSDTPCATLPELASQIVGILAGRAVDMRLGAGADAGSLSDLQQATTIAVAARASCGLAGSLVFRGMPRDATQLLASDPDLSHAVDADLHAGLAAAIRRVEADECAIRAVADELLRRRVMTGQEVETLIATYPPSQPVGPLAT